MPLLLKRSLSLNNYSYHEHILIWIQTSNKANQSKHWSFRHTKHKPPHRCLPAQCAGNLSSTSTRSSCFPLLVQIPGISGTSSQDCWNECRFFSTVGRPQMYLCHKEHSWPVKKWYEGKYVQCLSRIMHLSICNINIRPRHTTGIWHPFPGWGIWPIVHPTKRKQNDNVKWF